MTPNSAIRQCEVLSLKARRSEDGDIRLALLPDRSLATWSIRSSSPATTGDGPTTVPPQRSVRCCMVRFGIGAGSTSRATPSHPTYPTFQGSGVTGGAHHHYSLCSTGARDGAAATAHVAEDLHLRDATLAASLDAAVAEALAHGASTSSIGPTGLCSCPLGSIADITRLRGS